MSFPLDHAGAATSQPLLFGSHSEGVDQQGDTDEERDQAHQVDGFFTFNSVKKNHQAEADGRSDQAPQLQSFNAPFNRVLVLFAEVFDRGLGSFSGTLSDLLQRLRCVVRFPLLAARLRPRRDSQKGEKGDGPNNWDQKRSD